MHYNNALFSKSMWLGWLFSGALDITGAIIILGKGNVTGTLKYIASGLTGSEAFTGGTGTLALGILIHFTIAFCFTLLYFFSFPQLPFFRKYQITGALLYGTLIWAIMAFLVLPFTNIPPRAPLELWSVVKNILILSVAFGITLRYFAAKP